MVGVARSTGGDWQSFAEYANWLLPRKVLVGRYPYVEPFGWCRGEEQARRQIEQILDAGVTTFVCLQAELPAQDDESAWPADGVAAPEPYRGVFLPYARVVADVAATRGLATVRFLHVPMVDGEAPPHPQIAKLVDELESRLLCGERIYMHCWGGQGRAGLVASCLLGKLQSRPAWESMRAVQDGYRTRFHALQSPQTAVQRRFVRDFLAPRADPKLCRARGQPGATAGVQCILCTGGAGYIGSHTLLALRQAGYRVVALDNLSRASAGAVGRVRQLLGEDDVDALPLLRVDLRDKAALDRVFEEYPIDAVIHFAAFKAVNESVRDPLLYYDNNVIGLINLLGSMREHGVNTLVFSSSCTVYSPQHGSGTFSESSKLGPVNPYGRSKLHVENVLEDVSRAESGWSCCALRYFNPAGAHCSGELGEAPSGVVTNLVPLAQQVALGLREELVIFGDDYPTKDGTAVRDYVHVEDVAEGHVAALQWLRSEQGRREPFSVFNLGTGCGSSVLEVVQAFEAATGTPLPHRRAARRAGDAAVAVADVRKAAKVLGWKASRSLRDIVESALFFQKCNPKGYADDHSCPAGSSKDNALPGDLLKAHPGQLRAFSKRIRASLTQGALRTQVHLVKPHGTPGGASPVSAAFGVDLGGSTLRAVRAEPKVPGGHMHDFVITGRKEAELVPARLKSPGASAEDLFDFIAGAVAQLCGGDSEHIELASLVLGLSFSFPMDHLAADQAVLRNWTKGWATSGVVGEDIGLLFTQALKRRGLGVRALAVVNDCAATLLASPCSSPQATPAQLSMVIGTGTNACFVDPLTREVMNTEFGSLRPWELGSSGSTKSDNVALEDLVSCRSLPGAARTLAAAAEAAVGSGEALGAEAWPLCVRQLLEVLEEGGSCPGSELARRQARRHACGLVLERSSALCAAGLAALLPVTLRPPCGQPIRVVMDGFLIHEHPPFLERVRGHLSGLLCPGASTRVELSPVTDAAATGAMFAALGNLLG